jgi:hypothetical protein
MSDHTNPESVTFVAAFCGPSCFRASGARDGESRITLTLPASERAAFARLLAWGELELEVTIKAVHAPF